MKLASVIVTFYITCIMFISRFIGQQFCTILCILDHINYSSNSFRCSVTQRVRLIFLCASKNLQFNGAPWRWWYWTPKRVEVKCTLVQAWRLCTDLTAHRGSRGIAILFLDHDTRKGWGVSVTPRPLFTSRERPGTHCAGGWVGPRAGLDRCGKSRLHRDSIPGPSSP